MSDQAQKPTVIEREELKTDSKWMKLEKIHWKDQEGKQVRWTPSAMQYRRTTDVAEDLGGCQ